jgi:hypothetical protein
VASAVLSAGPTRRRCTRGAGAPIPRQDAHRKEALVALIGCGTMPGPNPVFVGTKVTRGGHLPSSSGGAGHKANFGFNAAQCAEEGPISGHFNFHDKHAPGFQPGGVKMNGSVVAAKLCSAGSCQSSSGCDNGLIEVEVAYRSTNPRFPSASEGTALACVSDNGEGSKASAPDTRVANTLRHNGSSGGRLPWRPAGRVLRQPKNALLFFFHITRDGFTSHQRELPGCARWHLQL